MKLRLRKNSIRLRLGQSELRRLMDGESLVESLDFGPGRAKFSYEIRILPDPIEPTATFDAARLTLTLAQKDVNDWANSDAVGIRATQDAGSPHQLSLLIEKDFECLDNAGEPQDDAFPHPSQACTPAR